MRQVAIDLEARNRTPEPDFQNPSGKWDVFAVSVSTRPDFMASPTVRVFVREDGSEHALRKMLAAVANHLNDQRPIDCLLGYNSERYDLPVLAGCLDEIADHDAALADYIQRSLDHPHRDLFAEIVDNQPDAFAWPSLTSALEARGIPVSTTHLDGELVEGDSMPEYGARILDGDGLSPDELVALREYAGSDVRPLHALADRLERDGLANEEAAAIAGGPRGDDWL